MKNFITIPQKEETILVNVNHIAAVKSVTFGEKQLTEIYMSAPAYQEGLDVQTGCLIIQSNFSPSEIQKLIEESLL